MAISEIVVDFQDRALGLDVHGNLIFKTGGNPAWGNPPVELTATPEELNNLVAGGGGVLTAKRIGFGSVLNNLTGDAAFLFEPTNKFVGVNVNADPTAAVQVYSNNNDGVQLDASIYIDRLISRNTAHSAHGLTDETEFNDTGVAQYASLDVKVTMVGNQNHLVGGQFRPRFEGASATIGDYVHGWNTGITSDEATHHLDLMAHFSAGTDSGYAGSIDFEAGFISGNFSKANEGWAFYTTQERSRFRGVTSFFGSTTAAISLTAQTWASTNGGQVTFTTATPHGLSDGDRFTTTGSTPSGYNSSPSWVARAGTAGSTIVVRKVTDPGASSVLGQVDASNDYAWNFFGDENTGFFRSAADTFTVVTGGINSLNIAPTETYVQAGSGSGPVRFYSLNANNNAISVSSIGSRSAASITSEAALITTPAAFVTSDWLFTGAAALRTNTALTGGLSVAVLAGDYRLYTSGSLLDMHVAPAYAAINLTAQTWAASQNTYTTATPHQLFAGMRVTIAGSTPSGYNGTYIAEAGTTGSTIIVSKGVNPGASTVLGTVAARPRMVNFPQRVEIGSLGADSADATLYLRRELSASTGTETGHGITIADDFSRDTFSYAAFDDDSIMSGSGTRGHHRAFQARAEININGTMDFLDSFHSDFIGTATASIGNVYHFRAGGDANYDGAITAGQYGLRIDEMTKGDTGIWGIWVHANACRFAAGTTINIDGSITNQSFYEGILEGEPAAPDASRYRIWAKNTGGKVELMVRFPTGASQQLAIEP